ncbi:hypothetical protein LCGC14_1725910, partial [marine sediment metagenome]
MKIYCILFDTVPRTAKIEELFKSKKMHYCDFITNSCTGMTLVSMMSGKPLAELREGGVGMTHTYQSLSDQAKLDWNKTMIFNNLPLDWKIHAHAMPITRGDTNSFRLVPDDICEIDR